MMLVSAVDLALDYSEGADFTHIAQEAVVLSLSLIALAWLLIDMRRQAVRIDRLRDELSSIKNSRKKPDRYVIEAKTSLSSMISHQFDDWQLSNSEKDVGWLLLKGLSLKEIAALRETLEKTVRQQASAIYRKADLNGRHAFSAWFIEEVL
ncbi:MAG TPA: response regulator transcription factor [Gammaproteobacteria bacterium]|nr:response regulator transcription factor [Gammaproteobacteria bacterium]